MADRHHDHTVEAELPDDLTATGYRRRARAILAGASSSPHGPRADRMVATAHVLALLAISATHDETCARSASRVDQNRG